jgi:ribonuclease R
VHRVIKALLHGKRYHLARGASKTPRRAQGRKPRKPATHRGRAVGAAGAHCSANERRADEASRDVEAWLKCRYMREHLGEEFGGTVTRSRASACSCTLDALYVEGWCTSPSSAASTTASTRRAGAARRAHRRALRVGARVRVQVSRVDLDGRKIDFRMVRDGDEDAALIARTPRRMVGARRRRAAELEAVKEADRAVKAATKGKGASGAAQGGAPGARARRRGAAARQGGTPALISARVSAHPLDQVAAAQHGRPLHRRAAPWRNAAAMRLRALGPRAAAAPTGRRASRPARRRCRRSRARVAGRVDRRQSSGPRSRCPSP